jgi:hypothetical protein
MKVAHPRPAFWATRSCRKLPCHCKAIFSRHTCEDKYQAAIQDIIADIRKGDPAPLPLPVPPAPLGRG